MGNLLLMNRRHNRAIIYWPLTNGFLPSGLTFSRASLGRRYNSSAMLVREAINSPAFEYNPKTLAERGLRIEPQRTNYNPRSWRISQWASNNGVATDGVYISPDGTQDASQIVTAAALQGRYRSVSGLTPSTYYAVSGFVKVFAGATTIKVGTETTEDLSSNGSITVNAETGAVVAQGSKVYNVYTVLLPNGWVYFRYKVKTGAAQTSVNFLAYSVFGASTFSVWGAQIEAGEQATSYIPTDGVSVTRAIDICYGTKTSSLDITKPYILSCEFEVPEAGSTYRYGLGFDKGDGTITDVLALGVTSTNQPFVGANISGTTYLSGFGSTLTSGSICKIVLQISAGANKASANGVDLGDGTFLAQAVSSALTQINIGDRSARDRTLLGCVRKVQAFQGVWSDAQRLAYSVVS